MQHLKTWQVAQLNHLFGDREGTRDQRLRRNHRGHGGQAHQRHQRPVGGHQEERVFNGLRVGQQQGALAEVIESERGHDHGKPGHPDGFFTKVTHVGVQRLTASDAQHHGAQNNEGGAWVVPHETQCVMRADGPQNGRVGGNMRDAQQRDAGEPDQRDGPKKLANAAGAAFLHGKQAKQNDQRERNHKTLEGRRHHLQTLHRRQH